MKNMPKIDNNTVICISIAEKPGNFGAVFHNSAYNSLGLNWVYLPREVKSTADLAGVINSVRLLNIRGCSVSMPHKEAVIEFVDSLDKSAEEIGAINTIVQDENGRLKGYNTDYFGAKKAIENAGIGGKEVLMIGAGGVAKAVGLAVKDLGGKLTIANRTDAHAKDLGKKLNAKSIARKDVDDLSGHLLINATSVGMNDPENMIVSESVIQNYNAIMDVVIYPAETKLLKFAKESGKKVIAGTIMCVYQAAEQFRIYTGLEAPAEIIKNTFKTTQKTVLLLDVDGVLTTGQFLYSENGKSYKIFGPHDNDGLKILKGRIDIKFVTADKRGFPISRKRIVEDMGFDLELVPEKDRYEYVKDKYGFKNLIYMGDGYHDTRILKECMFGIAPNNARREARAAADFVTESNSGEGAVLDACLEIVKNIFHEDE